MNFNVSSIERFSGLFDKFELTKFEFSRVYCISFSVDQIQKSEGKSGLFQSIAFSKWREKIQNP